MKFTRHTLEDSHSKYIVPLGLKFLFLGSPSVLCSPTFIDRLLYNILIFKQDLTNKQDFNVMLNRNEL